VTDPNVSVTGGVSQATSPSLLERARANDRAAWDRIVYLYSPLMYGWCRRWGLQDADILDVSQEVMRSVFTHLSGFRRDRPNDSFRKWLKTILRNRVFDFLSRTGRRPQAALADLPAATADDEPSSEDVSEQKVILRRALDLVKAEFKPQTWDAFWRVTVDETPVADVAQALGVSANVVYLSRSRVLRRLSDQFAALIDDWTSE
jgi:RNA polymerase sigma-70 factor (ECF subfamily)